MSAVLSALIPRRQVLVLSHMRSYSSVLSHVLGSHPEIDGYCETRLRYRGRFDLLRLRYRVAQLTGEPLRGRYVLDKILHGHRLSDSVLCDPRTVAIFLLRRPEQAVQSILDMDRRIQRVPWHQDMWKVADYYEERTRQLAELAAKVHGCAAFVQSEVLINRSHEVLAFLTDFLRLASPLRRDYRRFPKTGQPGFGDPSTVLSSGRLGAARPARRHCEIPPLLVERLDNAYAACLKTLKASCIQM